MRRFNLAILPTLALLVSVVPTLPALAGHGGGGHGGGGHGGFHGRGFHGGGFYGYGGFYPGFGYGGFYPGYGYGYGFGYPAYGYDYGSGYGYGAGPPVYNTGYPPVYAPGPAAPPSSPQPEQLPVPPVPVPTGNKARIHVRVPANAQLWVNGALTTHAGAQRDFDSPALTPGRTYAYEIKVRWMQDGQPVEQTREVVVQPNKTTHVNFLPARTTGSRAQETSPRR